FSPAETLTTYSELYVAAGAARAVTMMTSVQDARSGKTVFQGEDRRGVAPSTRLTTHAFSTQVPLKNLSAGNYILRVSVRSSVGGAGPGGVFPFEWRSPGGGRG